MSQKKKEKEKADCVFRLFRVGELLSVSTQHLNTCRISHTHTHILLAYQHPALLSKTQLIQDSQWNMIEDTHRDLRSYEML